MNHPSAWLLSHLAGIRPEANNITLKPFIPENLSWINASVSTNKGMITSSWRNKKGIVKWSVKIPPNQKATVVFPKESGLATTVVYSGEHHYRWSVDSIKPLQ